MTQDPHRNCHQNQTQLNIRNKGLGTKICIDHLWTIHDTIKLSLKINTIRLRTNINTIGLRTPSNNIRLRSKINTIEMASKSRLVCGRETQTPFVNHNSHTNQSPETGRTKQSKKRPTNCDHHAAPVSRVRTWPSQWCPQKCGHFLAANFGQQG